METIIKYNVCRENLGDDTTDAQYEAYKELVKKEVESAFDDEKYGDVVVSVGDSDFCNASICNVDIKNYSDDFVVIERDEVEQVVSNVDESWWDAE